MANNSNPKLAFIGFGEAAQAFLTGFRAREVFSPDNPISAFDIKTNDDGAARDAKLAQYKTFSIDGAAECKSAIADAEIIFSVVTADQAVQAAEATAQSILPGALYLDCNSCSPQSKQSSAALIEAAGGRYVDVAVMAPVHPKLHRTPVILSGPNAPAAHLAMVELDMDVCEVGANIGDASAIKLSRSIMVKGLEALTAECVLTARALGVEDYVLTSLEKSHPGFGWKDRSAQSLERMMVHGLRRAAEMREAASMVKGLGLPSEMNDAIVEWQETIGQSKLEPGDKDLGARADVLLDAIRIKLSN